MSANDDGQGRQMTARLRLAGWLAVGAWLVVLSTLARHPDGDMYHAMNLAREAIRQGWVPAHDLFAYTPTVSPSVHHEWGTGLVLYGVAVGSGLGGTGIILLKYGLVAALVACCYLNARRRGADDMVLLVCAPVAGLMVAVGLTTVRAQMFTLVFTAATLLLLHAEHRGSRGWLVPWLLLYTTWLNVHAGFVVGVGLLGLHFMERAAWTVYHTRSVPAAVRTVRVLPLAAVAMVPLTFVNPYGASYLEYLGDALVMSRPSILEWQPLWAVPGAWLFCGTWVLSLAVLTLGLRHGRVVTPGPLLVLVCAVLAMRHARHLSIYAVVWVSYVPAMVTGTSIAGWTARALRRDRPAVLVGLLTLACVGTTLAVSRQFWRLDVPTMPSHAPMMYPAGAVDYLRRHAFRGNVMTPFTQGAYVSWHLYPDVKVSMDARYEAAYPPGAFEESLAFYAGAAGWDTVLQRYDTDLVLAPMIARVTADLARAPGWVQIYGDASFALFARADVPNLPPVRRDDSTPVTTFP